MSGQSPKLPPLTRILSEHLARPVDGEARKRAVKHILDWVGCAVAGSVEGAAKSMQATLPEKTLLNDILYLGALGNILEMDDVDKRALLHPGPVIIPAALVIAQETNAGTQEILDAVVRGYEAVIRIGRAVGPSHYQFWHNTGTCGPFGAAAAAASLYGLDAAQTTHALGLAGTQASGLWQTRHEPSSQAKQLHTARAAHAGCLSAQLAKCGFVGVETILEGSQGFFAAMCGTAEASKVVDFDVASPWLIHEVSFKPWAACRHAHAAIDAALALRDQGVKIDQIETITVSTYRDAITFCDKPTPRDNLSAKFSLQHAVAIALSKGAPQLKDFEGQALDEEEVVVLRNKISVSEDVDISNRYPAQFGANVYIQYTDGAGVSWEQLDALGDPENPVTMDVLVEKAHTLMAHAGMALHDANDLTGLILSMSEETQHPEVLIRKLRTGVAR